MGGPVFAGVLLHLLVFFVVGVAGRDESRGEGLVRRRLDAGGQGSGGASGVLGFVAADGVSEGVFGDGPGAVEGVATGGSGEEGCRSRYAPRRELRAQSTGLRVIEAGVSLPALRSSTPSHEPRACWGPRCAKEGAPKFVLVSGSHVRESGRGAPGTVA